MDAPRKIVSLGFLEPESVEAKLLQKLQEVEDAKAQARLYVAPMIIASLVIKYNAAETTTPFNEWVLEGLNGVVFPWLGSDNFRDKVRGLYDNPFMQSRPIWPVNELTEALNSQLEELSRIPSEDGGLDGVLDGLEAHTVRNSSGYAVGSIRIKKKR